MLLLLSIALPGLGALAALLPGRNGRALAVVLAAAGLVALVLAAAHVGAAMLDIPWLPAPWRIDFRLGLGGFGAALALLASLATLLCVAAASAWPGGARALLLATGAAAVGVFLARDLVVLYVFWELMLFPAYFLIAGASRRGALQFLIYNVAGSLLMLLAFAALGGVAGFDLPGSGPVATAVPAGLVLAGLVVGFAVKAPLFPLHGWQADAYAAAPAEAGALLAGVQSKAGIFGFYLVAMPLLPDAVAAARPWLLAAGVIAVLYGGFCAFGQDDARRMLAYSSLGHLGLIFLGLFSGTTAGLDGAIILAVAHGLYTVALFLLIGRLERRLGRPVRMSDLGGLYRAAPGLGGIFSFAAMAALGLPGLAGFPGELLIVIGLWGVDPWLAAAAGAGIILAAVYMLRMVQAVFHGPVPEAAAGSGPADLGPADRWSLLPICALLLGIGLDPQLLWTVAHP